MTDLDEILEEVRTVGTKVEVLGERVSGHHEIHERDVRAVHARIDEVKKDSEKDVRELRTQGRKPALVSGAASGAGLFGIVELIRHIRHLFGNGGG